MDLSIGQHSALVVSTSASLLRMFGFESQLWPSCVDFVSSPPCFQWFLLSPKYMHIGYIEDSKSGCAQVWCPIQHRSSKSSRYSKEIGSLL